MHKVWRIMVVAATVCATLATPALSGAAHAVVVGSAYVLADQPTASSYTPDMNYQYNSTGAVNTITRASTGRYWVYLPNLGGLTGTVLVSAYGATSNYCKVASWGPPFHGVATTQAVDVRCWTTLGVAADTKFTMSYTNKLGGYHAWVWASDPSRTDEYTPDTRWQANSTGILNRVQRTATGRYNVYVPTGPPDISGHVQITSYGTAPDQCWNLSPWRSTDTPNLLRVEVMCVTPDGYAVDSPFVVTWVRNGNVLGQSGMTSMYAIDYDGTGYVSHPSGWGADSFYANGGGSVSIVRSRMGKYAVHSAAESALAHGNVQVNPFSTGGTWCSVQTWNPVDGILVDCYDRNGNPTDVGFHVSFTGR